MKSLTEVCDLGTFSLVVGLRRGKILLQFFPIIGQLIGSFQSIIAIKIEEPINYCNQLIANYCNYN